MRTYTVEAGAKADKLKQLSNEIILFLQEESGTLVRNQLVLNEYNPEAFSEETIELLKQRTAMMHALVNGTILESFKKIVMAGTVGLKVEIDELGNYYISFINDGKESQHYGGISTALMVGCIDVVQWKHNDDEGTVIGEFNLSSDDFSNKKFEDCIKKLLTTSLMKALAVM